MKFQWIALIFWVQQVISSPQIFTDVEFCVLQFPKAKKMYFPNKPIMIPTPHFDIYFNYCESPLPRCKNQSTTCLIDKKWGNIILLDKKTITVELGEYRIKWLGPICQKDRPYSVTLKLHCSEASVPTPILLENSEDCAFVIRVRSPDCWRKCTGLVDDKYFLDVRNLNKSNEVVLDDKIFSFNVCGVNKNCRTEGVSACEIQNTTTTTALANIDSQYILYDSLKNELTVRSRLPNKKVLEILIKCNWYTEMANATFKKKQIQSKRYNFEISSSYGCVKLPQNCLVIGHDNIKYNLSGLYRPNGFWKVANFEHGNMILNLCGSLQFNDNPNLCGDQYSQVCVIHSNSYTNRGSIASNFKQTDDIITVQFLHGSTCSSNVTLLYSTNIEFRCSKYEKGPSFKADIGCTTFIIWDTPHACPFDHYKGEDCYLADRFGIRNLKNLYTTLDKIHYVAPDTKLSYNICGPLHKGCNNFTNASVCLSTKEHSEVVVGWENNEIINKGGALGMDLSGEICLTENKHYQVQIEFFCNFNERPPAPIIEAKDDCSYKINVYTSKACTTENTFSTCIYKSGDLYYDLSPLIKKDKNYAEKDRNEDVDYIFNICGPIISGANELCKGNTMICLKNVSEANVKNRFLSIGSVSSPKLVQNQLIIESETGAYCEEMGYYRSHITFECSVKEEPMKLIGKDPCTYKFLWKTKSACPFNLSCIIEEPETNRRLNLSKLTTKLLKIQLESSTGVFYEIHLCRDVYKKYESGQKINRDLTRHLKIINDKPFLELHLNEQCLFRNDIEISKVVIEIICNKRITGSTFNKRSFSNCTLYAALQIDSNICEEVMPDLKQISIETKKEFSSENYYKIFGETDSSIFDNKMISCPYVNLSTSQHFNIKDFPAIRLNGINNFTLNTNGTMNYCNGFLCKDNAVVLPFFTTCPDLSFINSYVKLENLLPIPCDNDDEKNTNMEIWFKCDRSEAHGQIIQESSCSLIIDYYTYQLCPSYETRSPYLFVILGIVIAAALVLFFVLLKKKFTTSVTYMPCLQSLSKREVSIYMKDSTE